MPSRRSAILLRARDLADACYFEPLSVDDLARAAGLSRAHFSAEFRRAFGESPHAHLLTRRLERAAAVLRSTDRSVAEICASVGLRSVGSFTTSFKRTYGMTPTAYRRRFPPAPEDAFVPRIAYALLWVHDQDEALDFFTDKLGWEVRADVTVAELDNFRWLTVGPVGQRDVAVVLGRLGALRTTAALRQKARRRFDGSVAPERAPAVRSRDGFGVSRRWRRELGGSDAGESRRPTRSWYRKRLSAPAIAGLLSDRVLRRSCSGRTRAGQRRSSVATARSQAASISSRRSCVDWQLSVYSVSPSKSTIRRLRTGGCESSPNRYS
jgi:AraC-like DNA-binding protein/catechol 2,3-dioxygenase-like lactoylglutathione lyase family enzyme